MNRRNLSIRAQLNIVLTAIIGILISAIPVTVTFAQTYSNNSNINTNYMGSMPQYGHQLQQQYTYWCMGQSGGYYSQAPCPTYVQPQQPVYTQHYKPAPQYSYQRYVPQYSYYYPQMYYYEPMNYSYNYGYNYAYNYNYNSNFGDYSNYWY